MSSDALTFTPEERQQLVAARDMLVRRRAAHDHHDVIVDVIVSIEFALQEGCPHNPETHTLREIAGFSSRTWIATCHKCGASWHEFDRIWDR